MSNIAPNIEPQTRSPLWWQGAVIYHIYPRSFRDSNGDGIGDLVGIIEGLNHIAELGVDAIWISPFFVSPMDDFGYDISDFCAIDPCYGTMHDFEQLVEKAHGLNLRVIIDQVYSHSSYKHVWFNESRQSHDNPKADWYVWADPKPDGSPPNNWQSVFGGAAWQWDARRQQYYLHNFLTEQPDLNLHNPEVQKAMLDVARFWLNRGVDGFRFDALNFGMHDLQLRDNPPETVFKKPPQRPFDYQRHKYNMSQPEIIGFIEDLRKVMDEYGVIFSVAEVGGPFPLQEMQNFVHGKGRLNTAYGFDFLYAPDLTAARIEETINQWHDNDPQSGWPSWAFSNHDAPRAISRWRGDCAPDQYSKLLALLLMSLRGNIFIYQGEELGLEHSDIPFELLVDKEAVANWPDTLNRDGARTPIPWDAHAPQAGFSENQTCWLPVDKSHQERAITQQWLTLNAPVHFYKQAIALRKNSPSLRLGNIEFLSQDELLIFTRTLDEDRKLCVFNLTNKELAFNNMFGDIEIELAIGEISQHASTLPAYSGFIARL